MLSGWCGQRGKPNCKGCRSALCACRCHGANPAQNKGNGRVIETVEWDNGGTSKDAPAGAQTPVVPGLTATKERLMPTSTPPTADTPSAASPKPAV